MRSQMLLAAALLWGAMSFGSFVEPVQACPLCKEANETDPNLPRAYMISIIFMLAMPATVLTGFGVGFYRLSRKQQALSAAEDQAFSADADEDQAVDEAP